MIFWTGGKIILGAFLLAGAVIVGVVIGTYVGIFGGNYDEESISRNIHSICSNGDYPKYSAGVVTNGYECAEIGSNILRKGGSAADAAIASLFCEGVTLPQSLGLGGGFLLTIYTRTTGKVETLTARETAPAAATTNMYNGNATLAQIGALSVAVPGELKGYWALHEKYGKLKWKDLIVPTIQLCRKGHLVTKFLADSFKSKEHDLLNEPTLREIYIDPRTNKTWKEGQRVKRFKLADSLEVIAKEGADALYKGSLTKGFVKDIKERGGIITEEDMFNYEPIWDEPIETKLEDNMKLYTSPLPGSGVILTFILNILSGYLNKDDFNSLQNWQRIVESFKFGYGRRTELGDSRFETGMDALVDKLTSSSYAHEIRKFMYDNMTFTDPTYYGANYSIPEDHGTAHLSVIAPNGDAVSVTSTINLVFGAMLRSKSTGIILNNEMDDFSAPNITNSFDIPPSPANYIKPGKMPLSSMCPTIIVDRHGDVRLVAGAAGGSKITTTVAMIAVRNMWFGQSLKISFAEKRLHHQLFPMAVQYEEDFEEKIVTGLSKIGHKAKFIEPSTGFAAATAISRQCETLFGQYDKRRQGSIDLF